MIGRLRKIYKRAALSVNPTILNLCLRLLDNRSWLPVFYFFLPHANTNAMGILHVLHNIQVKTGRRVVVVSARPNWPWPTAKDRVFADFIRNLNPKISYVFIPKRLQRFLDRTMKRLLWILQLDWILLRPMGINSTFRLTGVTTYMHTDIVSQGGRVVFQIPKSHEPILEEKLRDIGITPEDWFVCIHAREHGFYVDLVGLGSEQAGGILETYRTETSDHRNVDIRTYLPAIKYITSLGGIVVRTGDPSMTRMADIEDIDGVIDYPFTEHWSMLMDLYLVNRCRFFLGCSSGITMEFTLPFGIPALVTNHAEPVESAFQAYDNFIFLFKHSLNIRSQKHLSLQEALQPGMYTGDSAQKFEGMGYRWLPNSSEDILEATKEMLDLTESNSFDRPRTNEQERFHQYRLKQILALSSSGEFSGRHQFKATVLSSAESRISASFAARHFAKEEILGA